ncbi:MAG: hypothetical protein IKA02_00215 [Clostridia bacterium]|nr:hypothetical protein [Clostridia bacterium]
MSNEKETKKSKMIYGRYMHEIENGTVVIPWLENKIFDLPLYYTILEASERKYISVHENEFQDSEELTPIENCLCQLDENNKWILPKSVLDIVGNESVVWLGLGNRAELTTEKILNENSVDIEELKQILLNLRF